MIQRIVHVNDYLTKSGVSASDYAINPYVGCPHDCIYCYASYMQKWAGRSEKWGKFIDIKYCEKKIDIEKLKGKRLTLSTVTDCYNEEEANFKITRSILSQLVAADTDITIITKSDLVLRDLDLLKQLKSVRVVFSINTHEERLKQQLDKAPSIERRVNALKCLHENGIKTTIFICPIMPGLTDFKKIIELSQNFVDEYWLDKLNLRGANKEVVFDYIKREHPKLLPLYSQIYEKGDVSYWQTLGSEINQFCKIKGVKFQNYVNR